MKEREFINPFTDFGFKRIFGQEINISVSNGYSVRKSTRI